MRSRGDRDGDDAQRGELPTDSRSLEHTEDRVDRPPGEQVAEALGHGDRDVHRRRDERGQPDNRNTRPLGKQSARDEVDRNGRQREERRVGELDQLVRRLLSGGDLDEACDEQRKHRPVAPRLTFEPQTVALRDRHAGLHVVQLVHEEARHRRCVAERRPRSERDEHDRRDSRLGGHASAQRRQHGQGWYGWAAIQQ